VGVPIVLRSLGPKVHMKDVLLHLEHDAGIAHLGMFGAEAPAEEVPDPSLRRLNDDMEHMIQIGSANGGMDGDLAHVAP
jgi:hypothetical protein